MPQSLSLSVLPLTGICMRGAWPGSQPAIPLAEFADGMGVKKHHVENLRSKYPELKLEPKVLLSQRSAFGASVTEFGELKLVLDTLGGPQEHVCFTPYGAFLHASVMRTQQARKFVRAFPLLMEDIYVGKVKAPVKIAECYRHIMEAPFGKIAAKVREMMPVIGKSRSSIYRHTQLLAIGQVTADGLPIMKRPGPPKGFGSKIVGWMGPFLIGGRTCGLSKKECHDALIVEMARRGDASPVPSLSCVQRFLR